MFIQIIVLMTRFKFSSIRELSNTKSNHEYLRAASFGRVLSIKRFENLHRCLKFISLWREQGELTSEQYLRRGVDNFASGINEYRSRHFTSSFKIGVDESISRWCRLGDHWIGIGLSFHVKLDHKHENGSEIVDVSSARSKIMLKLRIVKTAEERQSNDWENCGK